MAESIGFYYRDDEPVTPQHRWGKGYVVDDARSGIGQPDVIVDRQLLAERARLRRAEQASEIVKLVIDDEVPRVSAEELSR